MLAGWRSKKICFVIMGTMYWGQLLRAEFVKSCKATGGTNTGQLHGVWLYIVTIMTKQNFWFVMLAACKGKKCTHKYFCFVIRDPIHSESLLRLSKKSGQLKSGQFMAKSEHFGAEKKLEDVQSFAPILGAAKDSALVMVRMHILCVPTPLWQQVLLYWQMCRLHSISWVWQ